MTLHIKISSIKFIPGLDWGIPSAVNEWDNQINETRHFDTHFLHFPFNGSLTRYQRKNIRFNLASSSWHGDCFITKAGFNLSKRNYI